MTKPTVIPFGLKPGMSYLCTSPDQLNEIIAGFEISDRQIFESAAEDAKSIRALVGQAHLTPNGQARLILIVDAHLLTEIMQNTLLKILEEPPSRAILVLVTNQPNRLLPTILSRLSQLSPSKQSLSEAVPTSLEELTVAVADLTRPELVELLTKRLVIMRHQLLVEPTSLVCQQVLRLDLAIKKLHQNANQKLTVDWLLLRSGEKTGYISS